MTATQHYASETRTSISLPPSLPGSHLLRRYTNLGSVFEQYFLNTDPDYNVGEVPHAFSLNKFDPVNAGGTLRTVNVYMGIQGFVNFDIENPLTTPVHVYYGTWYFNGQWIHGPSHSDIYVSYASTGQIFATKVHNWPDIQVDLDPNTSTPPAPHGYTDTDACIYHQTCNELPVLVASITDPASLALWSGVGQLIDLSFEPFHKRYVTPLLWGDGHNPTYFASTRQTNAYFDVEFIYSY